MTFFNVRVTDPETGRSYERAFSTIGEARFYIELLDDEFVSHGQPPVFAELVPVTVQ